MVEQKQKFVFVFFNVFFICFCLFKCYNAKKKASHPDLCFVKSSPSLCWSQLHNYDDINPSSTQNDKSVCCHYFFMTCMTF